MKKIYSNVIKSLKNAKNKILQNKKILLFILLVIIVIILGIVIIANKEDIGNTSGNLNNSGFSAAKKWMGLLFRSKRQ